MPPQASPYADPSQADRYGDRTGSAPSSGSGGGGARVAYCVRLCDGRYFPIQRHANATPVQLCSALCPASQTKVFDGKDFPGVATQVYDVSALDAGTYKFECSIHPALMNGELVAGP